MAKKDELNDELMWIEENFGKDFMRFCRSNFPTLFETHGLVKKILEFEFAPTKTLMTRILNEKVENEFVEYILTHSFVPKKNENQETEQIKVKSPEELMSEAGYFLFPECQDNKSIQEFLKYYAKNEQLCTFFDPERLQKRRVWFAVKKNVAEIKRENFPNPEREDEYGTSVLGIQISRKNHDVHILNRYNHAVPNPDATYSNNLDEIISGLTEAFRQKYDPYLFQFENYPIPFKNVVVGEDGKKYFYFKTLSDVFNDDICFCENNVVIYLNCVSKFDPNRFEIIDEYVFDKTNQTIFHYLYNGCNKCFMNLYADSFIKTFGNVKRIKPFNLSKKEKLEHPNWKNRLIIEVENGENIELITNKTGGIAYLYNPNVTEVGDDFCKNMLIEVVDLPNLKKCGNNCFMDCGDLKEVLLANLVQMGDNCFQNCNSLRQINLPKLKSCEFNCFKELASVKEIILPALEKCKRECFCYCDGLEKLNLPILNRCFDDSFQNCNSLRQINLPNLEACGNSCFSFLDSVESINLQSLKQAGSWCFIFDKCLKNIVLDNLEKCGDFCFKSNDNLKTLALPVLNKCGEGCFIKSPKLEMLVLSRLKTADKACFSDCENLIKISLTNLKSCGKECFCCLNNIEQISLPNLENCPESCFKNCDKLKFLNLEKQKENESSFLAHSKISKKKKLDGNLKKKSSFSSKDFEKEKDREF